VTPCSSTAEAMLVATSVRPLMLRKQTDDASIASDDAMILLIARISRMEFSETTGIAVEEHAAESGRIVTFLLAPVVLDLDRLLAQSFANLEEMP
jgi:hypothetical protein